MCDNEEGKLGQVRELEAQLASERKPGADGHERASCCAGGDGGGAEWRRKHDALLARHQQLQRQLLAVRDIHGIDMPLLAGDVAVVADGAPTAAAVQATLVSVQARQDEAERRMQEVLQRREAVERKRSQEWQRKVDALQAQVRAVTPVTARSRTSHRTWARQAGIAQMWCAGLVVKW